MSRNLAPSQPPRSYQERLRRKEPRPSYPVWSPDARLHAAPKRTAFIPADTLEDRQERLTKIVALIRSASGEAHVTHSA